ncbi:M20/M25/M40 family metallo-hydrolase [Proteiniclasticum sp. QWL-01]|uniref:M20/M25/M40 family metallo-hydrolase n=1 Tax=Proteiniclasticum sp. QWL-01 TaxID=3036945 RepID=UPI002410197D|nr:M20/M25/M40 family metallo-hydrolase [Proteiniclasticum sp. QWL-01]WFF72388.1 M20/M25/M40 family metallo-hydrolase [Proteiniclasticum sp. QWL-01]
MERLNERIKELALDLTRVKSVVETPGEVAAADRIHEILSQFPYFREHPEHLIKVPVKDDELGRYSVLALFRGEAGTSEDTVITLGHYDTVGTSDYGNLEEFACDPVELTRRLHGVSLSPEARQDLESGNYLFGRGLFDMKTGDAILLAILEQVSAEPASFPGNLIYIGVCDEEANSKGMLAVLPELIRLKREYGLNYLTLLDTDYMTSEYPGDEKKYVYIGTVGKIMPSFYIVGKETHVGEAFKGLDANHLAARLVDAVDLNPAYCDVVEGEVTQPPVTLKLRDLKTEYSVQTSRTANVYFNVATHSSTPSQVLEKMKQAAQTAFEEVLETLTGHYRTYCEMAQRPFAELPFQARTLTYAQLLDQVTRELGDPFTQALEARIAEIARSKNLDDREKSLKIVEYVHDQWSDRDPVIIVYLTPPYYPHIYVSEADEKGRRLLNTVAQVVDASPARDQLVFKKFFPYISDLSYGGAPKDPKVIDDLKGNMPGFGTTYDLPLAAMQELDLPVLDIGPFGKDAHKFTERIETGYSFETAPALTYETIRQLLSPDSN